LQVFFEHVGVQAEDAARHGVEGVLGFDVHC
jgi:hypothetical protein